MQGRRKYRKVATWQIPGNCGRGRIGRLFEAETAMDYNLLDKEWIPVLYRDGRWERMIGAMQGD